MFDFLYPHCQRGKKKLQKLTKKIDVYASKLIAKHPFGDDFIGNRLIPTIYQQIELKYIKPKVQQH